VNVRIRFAKHGKVRFTSHRDVARLWERALRRAGVTVAYTEGFSPHPKLSFGLALPTGAESDGEYLDARLAEDPGDLDELASRLSAALPEGIDVEAVVPIDDGADSLQEAVVACTWVVDLDGPDASEARAAVDALLAATELPVRRERKGRERVEDLRPAVHALAVDAGPDGPRLTAVLATRAPALRPRELVEALDPAWRERRVCRTHQWIDDDGVRREPIPPTKERDTHVRRSDARRAPGADPGEPTLGRGGREGAGPQAADRRHPAGAAAR